MTQNLNDDLKKLSIYVYDNKKNSLPSGWEKIYTQKNTQNGFYGEAYKKNNEIVIVYRGTDTNKISLPDKQDFIIGDLPMWFGLNSGQYDDAKKMFDTINKKYGSKRIILTGHSLGGSLAQIVSADTGRKAVTFNAFGTGEILNRMGYKNQNLLDITNYGNENDYVFTSKINHQPGTTYLTNTNLNPDTEAAAKYMPHIQMFKANNHKLENMNELEKAVKLTNQDNSYKHSDTLLKGSVSYDDFEDISEDELAELLFNENDTDSYTIKSQILAELKKPQENKVKQAIQNLFGKENSTDKKDFDENKDYSNYINEVTKTNIIFTQEDIDNMSKEDYKKNQKAIEYQKEKIGIPTKKQAKESGLVYVSGYTRSDGTKVKSYYRARPA